MRGANSPLVSYGHWLDAGRGMLGKGMLAEKFGILIHTFPLQPLLHMYVGAGWGHGKGPSQAKVGRGFLI